MKTNTLQVIASQPMCNGLSLNVYGIEYDIPDKIIVGYNNDTPRKYKIYYTTNGNDYFRKNGQRFYLNDFMVVNY